MQYVRKNSLTLKEMSLDRCYRFSINLDCDGVVTGGVYLKILSNPRIQSRRAIILRSETPNLSDLN